MMKSGTLFKQKDILLVLFPFSGLSSVKQRPVLLISCDYYNKFNEDIVTCGITSNLKDAAYSVMFNNSDLVEGRIPTKSRIKADKLFTLNQSIVKKKLGRINNKIFEKVKTELLKLL